MSEELGVESWDYTPINIQKYYYRWPICNFRFYLEQMQESSIKSPAFSSGANDTHEWCLKVHLNGVDEESKGYLSVSSRLLSCPKHPVWAKFQLHIHNAEGKKSQTMKIPTYLRFLQYHHWTFRKIILRDFIFSREPSLLPDSKLILMCKMNVVQDDF